MTRGRVEVGFGTGYQQYEFQRFGVNLAENRAMFEEALELLTTLLSTENVSHQGRYWTLPETTTLPRPITKPHPQFWRATSTVPTMAWSLERGIKVITGGPPAAWTGSSTTGTCSRTPSRTARWLAPGVHYQQGVYVSDSAADARAMLPMPSGIRAHGPWPVLQLLARQRRSRHDRTDRPGRPGRRPGLPL